MFSFSSHLLTRFDHSKSQLNHKSMHSVVKRNFCSPHDFRLISIFKDIKLRLRPILFVRLMVSFVLVYTTSQPMWFFILIFEEVFLFHHPFASQVIPFSWFKHWWHGVCLTICIVKFTYFRRKNYGINLYIPEN